MLARRFIKDNKILKGPLMSSLKALRFTRAEWLFSTETFIVSMLAIFVASWAQGTRPRVRDHAYVLRTMDRIALLTPRLATIKSSGYGALIDASVSDLRLGADLLKLRQVRGGLQAILESDIAFLFTQLANWQRVRIAGAHQGAPDALLAHLDAVLSRLAASQPWKEVSKRTGDTIVSTPVDLRLVLFPSARLPDVQDAVR